MRYDTEHKGQVRKRILAEAVMVLQIDGPDGVSVASLMSRLGLTHGGFYGHFSSKEDLVLEAVDQMLDASLRELKLLIDRASTAEIALLTYLDFYLSLDHVKDRGEGCALPSLAGDIGRMGTRAKDRLGVNLRRLNGMISTLLEAVGFTPDEAAANANSMFAELVGAVTLARAAGSDDEAKTVLDTSNAVIRLRMNLPPKQ